MNTGTLLRGKRSELLLRDEYNDYSFVVNTVSTDCFMENIVTHYMHKPHTSLVNKHAITKYIPLLHLTSKEREGV